MSKIIQITDQNDLVPANKFPYAKFPFEHLNPVQSRICEVYDKDANFLIAAATSSGKTIIAEQLLSYEVRVRKNKGMYLSPYKALTQEKIDDWMSVDHHFNDLNLSIISGDYRLTSERKKELDKSNIILATTELLNSLTRNFTADKSEFLKDIKTIVSDETQLILEPQRGDKAEIGLVKLTKINPDVRIVGLSATMPNVMEIAEWLSKLNGKDTYVLNSNYRPCPLQIHYIAYNDSFWKYDAKEQQKINTAIDLITTHFKDKFLVVVHSKKTGEMLISKIKEFKIEAAYHNADLPKDKRITIETRFRKDPKLRVLVATCGVGTGLNLPARRVIVLGVHSGLTEVASYKIRQYCGRSGRVGLDPRGDAYVLVPQKTAAEQAKRLSEVEPIRSQLVDQSGNFKVLAFHLVSEINHGEVKTQEDIFTWYDRTLAAHQNQDLEHELVEKMIKSLLANGIIKEENGVYKTTNIGRIASLFYFNPYDIADLNKNFNQLFEDGNEYDDYHLSLNLANLDSYRIGFMSALEKEQTEEFVKKMPHDFCGVTDSVKKTAYVYFCLLNGVTNPVFGGLTRGLQADFPRLSEVLLAMDGMFKWNKKDYVNKLAKRISSGVDWNLLELCSLPGIGKVKANKLWNSNIKSLNDVISKPNIVKIALGLSDKKVKELSETAELINLKGM